MTHCENAFVMLILVEQKLYSCFQFCTSKLWSFLSELASVKFAMVKAVRECLACNLLYWLCTVYIICFAFANLFGSFLLIFPGVQTTSFKRLSRTCELQLIERKRMNGSLLSGRIHVMCLLQSVFDTMAILSTDLIPNVNCGKEEGFLNQCDYVGTDCSYE